jgi:DNA-binding GntR family transcriptional regulator
MCASKNRSEASLDILAWRCLFDRLMKGVYSPGERIKETPLAAELGISRTPVRAAIRRLANEGFLDITAHAGAVVKSPSRKQVEDLYEVREILECHAVKTVAEKGNSGTIREIEEAFRDMKKIVKRSGKGKMSQKIFKVFLDADFRFHARILEGAGNSELVRTANRARLFERLALSKRDGLGNKESLSAKRYHEKILKAILAGNSRQAADVMSEHIRSSCRRTLEQMPEGPEPQQRRIPEALLPYV